MILEKKYLIASIIGIAIFSVIAVVSFSTTGFFSKAFSKTVQPNQVYQENVSIRKFYNLTIRFRTSPSGSDLAFSDSDAVIVLKDISGNEIFRATGVSSGKNYSVQDKLKLDSVATADSSNIDGYANNLNQVVNVSYIGTKAYITILLSKAGGNATVTGFVFDELTNQNLQGITISAFNSSSDPTNSVSAATKQTDSEGIYTLILPTDSDGQSYDFYISDYSVSP
jgi:hypothetical protein